LLSATRETGERYSGGEEEGVSADSLEDDVGRSTPGVPCMQPHPYASTRRLNILPSG
jgi:hypothetical protein